MGEIKKVEFIKSRYEEFQEWEFQVEPIKLLSSKEKRYIYRCIDIREFNQPKDKWLRSLLKEFKYKFNARIGKYLNERKGKVIDTMQLQAWFGAHFYTREK